MKRTTRFALGLSAAVLFSSCADAEPEAQAPEPVATPEGVFGQAPAAMGGIPSVITLEPLGPVPSSEQDVPTEALMDQLALAFSPAHLLVRQGTTVRFQNSEVVAHNVHVSAIAGDSTVFNEDTLLGQFTSFRFDVEGGYDVKCDVHPGMTAFIFVTSAPHAVLAGIEGGFELPDVPAGEYSLELWTVEEAARSEQVIVVTDGEGTEVTLR